MEEFYGNQPIFEIINNMMSEADTYVMDFFTKGCHHRNVSMLFIMQNLFHQVRGKRDISLNAHRIIYF